MLHIAIRRYNVSIISTNMFGDVMKKGNKSTKDTGHSFEDYFKRALNPLLVLLLLSERSMYVYEMTREISNRSDGRYNISLLYPVIQRLLSQGYLREGQKTISDDNRVRQYYEITSDGIAYLRQMEDIYAEMSKAVQQIHINTGGDKT